jgi:hypothetical protein
VHPEGLGPPVSGDTLTTGFGPYNPDYVGIAKAASGGARFGLERKGSAAKDDDKKNISNDESWLWGRQVGRTDGKDHENVGSNEEGLDEVFKEAVRVVIEEGRCSVLDCLLDRV